jgi:hypothetical protein
VSAVSSVVASFSDLAFASPLSVAVADVAVADVAATCVV